MTRTLFATTIVSLCMMACAAEDDSALRRNQGGEDGQNGQNGASGENAPGDPTQPGSCAEGSPHVGFGAQNFVQDRAVGAIGAAAPATP